MPHPIDRHVLNRIPEAKAAILAAFASKAHATSRVRKSPLGLYDFALFFWGR